MKDFQNILGYHFQDTEKLQVALTHKSFDRFSEFNERLEFLGDAVIELCVTDWLFEKFPESREGELTRMRASLVNAITLTKMSESLELTDFIRLGKESQRAGLSDRVISSCFEAVIGAIFLDSGYLTVSKVLLPLFEKVGVEEIEKSFDSKTRLQELVQAKFKVTPDYQIVGRHGPDHNRQFEATVEFNEKEMGRGHGKSKREAEQQAAAQALEKLK